MKILRPLASAVILAAALAACSPSPKVTVGGDPVLKHITLDDSRVGANAPDGSTAWIDPTGAVEIDGKPVTLTAGQRALALQYHAEAMALQAEAVAMGKAGIAMAGKTLGNVASGLLSGNPDEIGGKVETDAGALEAKAMQLCQRVGKLQTAQDALAGALPAFAPYATIDDHQDDECAGHTTVRHGSASGPSDSDLLAAASAGDHDAVRRLVEQGADVDARVRGDGTALIQAAKRGDLAIVDELLRLGADANQASRGDGNPLIAASAAGRTDVVERLLAAGADVNGVVAGDETALINAARRGHLDVVKLLVDRGADVNLGVTADFGKWRSPLNQASDGAVRDYLISQGAVADKKA